MIDIERLTNDLGWLTWGGGGWHSPGNDGVDTEDLARFANAVLEAAAVECAAISPSDYPRGTLASEHIATVLRAMKVPTP